MPQVINTNAMSLMARNNLNKSQGSLNNAIEHLSSGLRINSAKDGASEQAIANRFTANIRGLTQASRNANDGISISQTAEGALNEINNNVQRIRELAVKAANGTNSTEDKMAIQKEIDQRLAEINRISAQADFNGTKLLAGEKSSAPTGSDKDKKDDDKTATTELVIQVGANDGETISIQLSKMDTDTLGIKDFKVTSDKNDTASASDKNDKVNASDKNDTASEKLSLKKLDDALAKISDLRSQFGAAQSRFESAIANIDNTATNLIAARSRIEDADYAEEVSNMTRAQILQQAGTSVLAQANQVPQLALSLLK